MDDAANPPDATAGRKHRSEIVYRRIEELKARSAESPPSQLEADQAAYPLDRDLRFQRPGPRRSRGQCDRRAWPDPRLSRTRLVRDPDDPDRWSERSETPRPADRRQLAR